MRLIRVTSVAVAVLVLLAQFSIPPVAGASLVTKVINEMDTASTGWYVVSGDASTSTVSSPRTSGTGALRVTYDLRSASQAQLALVSGPSDLPGLPRRVSVDVDGDGSWNVIYLQVRDATGEIFHFPLGNLAHTGWETLSTDLGNVQPATTMSGDHDGVLDLPIHVFKLIIDRNPGALDLTSTVTFDKLTLAYEPWSSLRADSPIFYPASGQATNLRFGLAEGASFDVSLIDEMGRTRHWAGTDMADGADSVFRWNGRDGNNVVMTGSVRSRLLLTRGAITWRYDVPYVAGLPARREPSIPGSIAGINSTMTQVSTLRRTDAENQARLIEGAWLRTAREGFDWNRVEPRKGWFDWAVFDQSVEVANAHNIGLVGVLGYSADWASSAPANAPAADRQFYPPSSNTTYAAYARAVVHRYKARVHVWEIWNEPNTATFWKPAPNAASYSALLKAASAAIHAEDPTATVLVGGLAAAQLSFMKGIATAGGWSAFDGMAIHTYVGPQPEQSMIPTWLDTTRAFVDSVGHKPIWITEFGWSTYTGSGSGYVGVSESHQAEYTARAYLAAAKAGVRGVFAFNLIELGTSTTSRLQNYGVVEQGGRVKPAYSAIRRVAEALDQGTSGGVADPDATTRTRVSGLDTPTGWKAYPLGGGSATLTSSSTRHGGSASLRLGYSFTTTSSGVELKRNLTLASSPTSVSVWVLGDGSANPVYLKVRDKTGETFQAAIGSLQSTWQRLTMYGDGADLNWTHSGGDNDGAFDYPLTVESLFVFRGGIGRLSGTAYFDDVEADFGPRERGLIISRRNGLVQSLYSLGGTTSLSVPVPGTNAWIVNGGTSTRLAVSDGRVSVSVGAMPVNVLATVGIEPASFTPGTGFAQATWIAGDRSRVTFQIVSVLTGKVVRHVWVDRWFDAGAHAAIWDGKVAGAAAPPGKYLLRLANVGPDGRVSYLLGSTLVE